MKRKESAKRYAPTGTFERENEKTHAVVNGTWREEDEMPTDSLLPLQRGVNQNYSVEAKLVHEELKECFTSPIGEVHWQYKYI
ncbi:hypothetical protein NQ314_008079 [Rhamnusium bicolor]|uniref:Uncharacterized protein n=1 Tax=Rhamnusium bicolor TaxID=1586634 RepID=A0AAV8YF47_9CUCU|nr:hypothetical protein NQ314_008079 [Rhamnusium bicolor]